MVDEWTTVEVALKIKMIERLEQVSGRKIDDIIEKLVEHDYKLKCTFIPVMNRCIECGREIKLFLAPDARKKTIAWMSRIEVQCSVCKPGSLWKRIR